MNPSSSNGGDKRPGSIEDLVIPRKKRPPPDQLNVPVPRKSSATTNSRPSIEASSSSTFHQPEASSSKVIHLALPGVNRNGSGSVMNRTVSIASQSQPTSKTPRIQRISDNPLILRISTKGLPLTEGIPKRTTTTLVQRSSTTRGSVHKRSRSVYREDTDSEDDAFLMDTDEEQEVERRKRLKKQGDKGSKASSSLATAADADAAADAVATTTTAAATATAFLHPLDPNTTDAPPPGTIPTLWYSRECFLHVFVLDKICGWKTRPKVQLIRTTANDAEGNNMAMTQEKVTLDLAQALTLQNKLLTASDIWNDSQKRMEVSRIHATQCPFVMALYATEQQDVKLVATEEREEVLLVKWRGRSYLHCSWERASDLQRMDTSNNSTARHKIRRYYQQQETALGPQWKGVFEEERLTAAKIHSHGGEGVAEASAKERQESLEEAGETEEYFSTQCLEVERILACDENEMNMQVLAKQRALNMQDEQDAIRRKEEEQLDSGIRKTAATKMLYFTKMLKGVELNEDKPWDPEDNVRYVVKWKGLPYSEMTWEYWRDIKRDAVDEAEDFWYRQQAPDPNDAALHPVHPHMQLFRKLQESATYGISSRERPVADLVGTQRATSSSMGDDDDNDNNPGFRLRSYQLEGVNWLLFNWWNKRSCILADEMGLGKTIQSAAFLRELQVQPATQVRGPFLVVAPLSLVGQWQSELASWAPDMNVVLYHGSASAREFLVEQEFYYTEQFVTKPVAAKLKKKHITKFHVLITTYEVVLKDLTVFTRIRWKALIVDEAHRLKNPKARLFELLASVPRDYCVLLTGTPIANATEELWALLHFANPRIFAHKDDFLEKFGQMTDAKQVSELHSLLKPYLLRRVKEDVEKSLPPKEETILEVTLTPIQKTFYKAIYERNTSFLFKGSKPSNAPSLMNVMMELRKCCNHPYLVKGAEDRILAEAAAKLKDQKDESGKEIPIDYTKLFAEQLVKSSGKMVLMEKLLQKLFAGGHKVLVFSQMVRVLDLLEELLRLKKYRYERLDGSKNSSSRSHAVERFSRKSCQRFVMLLSTRAGGLGLNLVSADTVIIFDSDWNPQNDLQAMARAHRIGQTRAVRVYRLLTAKTYEMHMFHSASLKLGLERAVLSQNRDAADESDENNKSNRRSEREAQAKEIDELLKKGAYDVFRDEDDAEGEKFMETDIDQLLEHSSKKVTYGAAATSSLGSGLGSFSKASFVANTDDGTKDVDLDDPDFWSKAVGLDAPEETPEDVAQMIDDGVKRSRKQVQTYDPYADTAEAEQRKKDRIALEKMLEKEEKERLKLEKKQKKQEVKEKKKREREQQKTQQLALKQKAAVVKAVKAAEGLAKQEEKIQKNETKEPKPKKTKKSERQRVLRRAENADPVLERLKQAWEVPQRNRAMAAAIRFGFARLCKVRSESNLTGLPIQDLEVFFRSFVYQLSLQVAVMLLVQLSHGYSCDLRSLVREWLGVSGAKEVDWISDSIQTAMKLQLDIESGRRSLRMPVVLSEPSYMTELRQGAALRALRRIGVLGRLNRIVGDCMDSILTVLGHEALGKRGCTGGDLSVLDADLKSRLVTTEELALAVGARFRNLDLKPPASWWDRNCDVALVIGTFVYGLGNYEAMRNDNELPFVDKLSKAAEKNKGCVAAIKVFRSATAAARQVFDDALEAGRIKAELEVQAAVAAAAKAALKREEDAAVLRKGGAEAEAVISSMPETQVEDAFAFDGTDSHFVTLPRMSECIRSSVHKEGAVMLTAAQEHSSSFAPEPVKSQFVSDVESDLGTLQMPDARVLDHRLVCIMNEIEKVAYPEEKLAEVIDSSSDPWVKSNDVQTMIDVRQATLCKFAHDFVEIELESAGIGLGGTQCGSSHRTLNDGSDYGSGSASTELAQIAYGTDAPRYLRALGVPMNLTRFAVTGLVYADPICVKRLLKMESLRYYGKENETGISHRRPAEEPPSSEETNEKNTANGIEKNEATNTTTYGTSEERLRRETNASEDSKHFTVQKDVNGSEAKKKDNPSVNVDEKVQPSTGLDPITLMLDAFRYNAKLRASICTAVLLYGFPSKAAIGLKLHPALISHLLNADASYDVSNAKVFDGSKFREMILKMDPDLSVPDVESLFEYVENFLMPHCLRLCIDGNGAATRCARGSHGDYATAFGVSIHPEPSQPHPSPLPDPCLSLQAHSLEALVHANALLRRVRLVRSCSYLVSGKDIPLGEVVKATKSDYMGSLDDMPVWWCPWIHDVALLTEAATDGLFSILPNRSEHPLFSEKAVQQHLYSSFVANKGALPAARRTPPEKVTEWIQGQSKLFPSVYQIERRLAILCSIATAQAENEDDCFVNVPMFDHGAWPRN